jgi:hypothetical protein
VIKSDNTPEIFWLLDLHNFGFGLLGFDTVQTFSAHRRFEGIYCHRLQGRSQSSEVEDSIYMLTGRKKGNVI